MPYSREPHARKALRLLTLGGAAMLDTTGVVVVEQRRRLALLVLVASSGERGVSRDKLIASLSPESPTDSARHALHQLLYYLRQQVGDDALLGTDPLRLNREVVAFDVADLEAALDAGALEDAVALYRGPFLDGFHLGDSTEFEEWAAGERARLSARHADALGRLADAAAARGDYPAACTWWRRLAAVDPLSGRAALGLVRSLVAMGDRTGAIRHARMHEGLVHAEIGGEAEPELGALVAELQRADRRAVSRGAGAITRPAVEAEPAPGLAPAHSPPRRRLLAAGVLGAGLMMVLAAVLGGRSIGRSSAAATAVAVLPFRVTAADSSLAWLQEGLVELLTIRLAGDAGVETVDAARVLRGWHHRRPEDPARFAAEIGAGRVIEGSVLGDPRHAVLTATMLRMPDGAPIARATAEGPLDSMPGIVDLLAAQLLGLSAGVSPDRLAALTSASLPAIREYLAGRAAFRRGRYEEAVLRFRDAVTLDSTFALAGLDLARTAIWTPGSAELGLRAAEAGRRRLGGGDQVLLDAMLGQFRSATDMFGKWNAAVKAYPDRPETWYGLGDTYFHWGHLAGIEDALTRAETAFRRGWALDSAAAGDAARAGALVAEPVQHLVELARLRGDTAEVRRLVDRVLAADSGSDLAQMLRWHVALLDGPEALDAHWYRISDPSQQSLMPIMLFITWTGVGMEDYLRVAAADLRRLRAHQYDYTTYALTTIAYNQGRPGDVPGGSEVTGYAQRQALRFRVRAAMWWDGDSLAGEQAARVLARYSDTPPAAGSPQAHYEDVCTMAHLRMARGDFASAEAAADRLMAARIPGLSGADSASYANYAKLCAALLDAARASGLGSPDALDRLVEADSLARDFIFEICCGVSVPEANLLLARLWEKEGDLPRALEAVRRRSGGFLIGPQFMTTFLREEGRLAALSGDTVSAIRAYRHYLGLRHNPEPAVRPEVERVRRQLGVLTEAARRDQRLAS